MLTTFVVDLNGNFATIQAAVDAAASNDDLTILDSSIRNNYANGRGGGVYIEDLEGFQGEASIQRTEIVNNISATLGGGVFAGIGGLEVNQSTIAFSSGGDSETNPGGDRHSTR